MHFSILRSAQILHMIFVRYADLKLHCTCVFSSIHRIETAVKGQPEAEFAYPTTAFQLCRQIDTLHAFNAKCNL